MYYGFACWGGFIVTHLTQPAQQRKIYFSTSTKMNDCSLCNAQLLADSQCLRMATTILTIIHHYHFCGTPQLSGFVTHVNNLMSKNNLSLAHCNTRCLSSLKKLSSHAQNHHHFFSWKAADTIALSEARVKETSVNSNILVTSFFVKIFNTFSGRRCVQLYIKSILNYTQKRDLQIDKQFMDVKTFGLS